MFGWFSTYFIGFCMIVQCQYNYYQNFEYYFMVKYYPFCPKYHTPVFGLFPHTCVSYINDCFGVKQVEVKWYKGAQILCHPNYQINFSSEAQMYKNFYVDPTQSISISVDKSNQFHYTSEIQIPNCFIVYIWYTTVTKEKKYHCWFYSGPYIFGNYPYYRDDILPSGARDLYSYGGGPFEFTRCTFPCYGCSQWTNCTSCFYGYNYVTSTSRDCTLMCHISGGLCDEQHPTPVECKQRYRKVITNSTYFECVRCEDPNCLKCEDDGRCTQCDTVLQRNDSFNIYEPIGKNCRSRENCIEYSPEFWCLQTNIGSYLYSGVLYSSQQYVPMCAHANIQGCFVCYAGYYLENKKCVPQQQLCNKTCNTCYANDPAYCTSCFFDEKVDNGKCTCPSGFQLFQVDGHCINCKRGVCETCINFYDCITCKPETFRYLDGTKCYCLDGYYDSGDELYICQKCHPTCLTCFGGDLSSCITCGENQNRHLIKGQCACDLGYGEFDIDYSNLVCQKCNQRCKTCLLGNNQQSCTSCLNQQFRQMTVNTDCQCIENYGDNAGSVDICFTCHFSCGTCIGVLQTDCISCAESLHRQLIINVCICQKGYYESPYQQSACLSCHYSCVDCLPKSDSDQCTECPLSRVPDEIGMNFSCICKDSNYFDDGVSQECQPCHYSCLTCTFAGLSYCSSCDLTIRKYSYQKCVCLTRTYDDGISTCLQCDPSCLTCSGQEITDCLTCSTDIEFRQLVGGSCVCADGYFEDNGQQICQQCSYRCQTCSISKDQCLNCAVNSFRVLGNDNSCQCPKGFYDQEGKSVCLICHLKCLTCFGLDENQCIDCKPLANRQFSQNQCFCQPHYYEENVEQCSICSSACYECQISYNKCTSCYNDRNLVGNTCQCNTKIQGLILSTFEINGSLQCQKCHYSCLTCDGPSSSKCTSCSATENRYLVGAQCLCTPGYFDTGLQQCQKCGYQCFSCIYQENQCLSCQQNSLRNLITQSYLCACQTGYYDDGVNPICQECDYQCVQCSINQSHCLTCQIDSYRQFNEILFTCKCISGYYDGGEAICQPCHYSCYECLGSTNQQCKSCKTFNISKRAFLDGKCICQTGYYDDGYSSNCQPCDVSCKACEIESYHCTACSTSRKYSNSSCLCQSGYFDIGQSECVICNSNCLQCKINAVTCIACDSNKFRILNDQTKSCVCQSNYLEKNGECLDCDSSCLTCSTTITNCSSCDSNRNLSNNQCLCQDGFFNFQGDCQICHKSCLTCKDKELFCLSCSSQNYRQLSINHTCDCIDGYFDQLTTNSCEQCDYSCKTCSQNSTNCTSCEISQNYDIFQNKCLCKLGYYYDQPTKICLKCHISCLTCIQYEKCTSCIADTRTFDSQLQTCDCSEGFYEVNQIDCLMCNYQCQTCQNSDNYCLSCHPLINRELQGNKCLCQQGFYDAGVQICFPCGPKCKTCVDQATKCTLCYEIDQMRVKNGNVCECQQGYFDNGSDICQKCSIKCKTCVGSAEYCTSCDIYQKRLDHSVIHKCPCVQGFYEDPLGICQKCHIKCEACLNSRDNCLNCNNPQKSNRYLLSNQCNCKPGFYDDDIQLQRMQTINQDDSVKQILRLLGQMFPQISNSNGRQIILKKKKTRTFSVCLKGWRKKNFSINFDQKDPIIINMDIFYQNKTNNSKKIFGPPITQKSPKMSFMLPNSFQNNSIPFFIQVMDQGGSITYLFGQTEVENQFNCTKIQNQYSLNNLNLHILISYLIQYMDIKENECIQIKQTLLTNLLNFDAKSSQNLSQWLKAVSLFKNYQSLLSNRILILDEFQFQSCYNVETKTFQIIKKQFEQSKNQADQLDQIQKDLENFAKIVSTLTQSYIKLSHQLKVQTIEWDQDQFEQYDDILSALRLSMHLADIIYSKMIPISMVNEQLFLISKNVLNLIDKISNTIQETAQVNGDPEMLKGEILIWKLHSQSRSKLREELGQIVTLEDQIIKYSQSQQIELNFNPYRFSNLTLNRIKEKYNVSKIQFDQTKMKKIKLTNFLNNGYSIVSQEINEKFMINMLETLICKNDTTADLLNQFQIICILIKEDGELKKCNYTVNVYKNQVKVYCICSAFGDIFLIYQNKIINLPSNGSNVGENQDVQLNSSIFNINIQSPFIAFFFSYLGLTLLFYLWLVIFSKQLANDSSNQETKQIQIRCYPGNIVILKQNFKYLHQLLQFYYYPNQTLEKPFLFINVNLQFVIMLLVIYLVSLDIVEYNNYLQIIIALQVGIAQALISKIFQGFLRLNKTLKRIIHFTFTLFFYLIMLNHNPICKSSRLTNKHSKTYQLYNCTCIL